eukprot:g1331.t1
MSFLVDYFTEAIYDTTTTEGPDTTTEEEEALSLLKYPLPEDDVYLHSRHVRMNQDIYEHVLKRAIRANRDRKKKNKEDVEDEGTRDEGRPRSHRNMRTLACDLSHVLVRQKGYAKEKKKAESLPAPYILVGVKCIGSNVSIGKLTKVCKRKLFDKIVQQWTKEIEASDREATSAAAFVLNSMETVVDNLKRDKSIMSSSETIESRSAKTSSKVEESSSETDAILQSAREFAAEQEKERVAEAERLRALAAKSGKSSSRDASDESSNRRLDSLPEYIVWNVVFPSQEPDSGLFMGLFGTDVQPDDRGQNCIALFRLDPAVAAAYREDVRRYPEEDIAIDDGDGVGEKSPPGMEGLKLFARYVRACVLGDRSFDPVKNRFKLVARLMPQAFADAGLGWLSGYNGKPKILRDTVSCTYYESAPSKACAESLRKMAELLRERESETEGGDEVSATATKCDQDSSPSPTSIFEIETDIMRWTKPMGIPLRAAWKLAKIMQTTISTFSFTIEGQNDSELPERIIAGFDLVACDMAGGEAVPYGEYMGSTAGTSGD